MSTVTIDGVEYIRKDDIVDEEISGEYIIFRCRDAGVHAGYLESRDSDIVRVRNSRRLWQWWSEFSLSGLAMYGPLESHMADQRYACVLPVLELRASDVCEYAYCTEKARKAIEAVPKHVNE